MAKTLPKKFTNPKNILNKNEKPSRVFHLFRFCTKPFNSFTQYPLHHEGFQLRSILHLIHIKWTIEEHLCQGTPEFGHMLRTKKKQDPSICWPFRVRYEYSDILNESCRVHLSNRRVPENVEAPEPLVVRRNTEGANVVDENHTGAEFEHDRQLDVGIGESLESFIRRNIVGVNLDTPAILTVAGLASVYELKEEAKCKADKGNIGNGSTSNPVMQLANVSSCPNEDIVDEGAQTDALDVVRGNEVVVYNGIGTRSENEADIGNGCPKVRHVQPLKRKFEGKKPKMAKPAVAGGLSKRGRLLKPTLKLRQLANSTGAPAGEGTSGSERKQPKRLWLNAIIAQETSMPRIPAETKGNQDNRLQSGVANPNGSGIGVEVGVSEPSGSRSLASQAGQANGVTRQADVVNPNELGVGGEVGGSGPSEPTSVAGQTSGAHAFGRQTDMVVPLLEPMVCVTNRSPMDLSIEEAKKYMRTE